MLKASFRTQNGHYLIANAATSAYRIRATADGPGPWEVFTIIPTDGRDTESIVSGDRIYLQTHFGRYVMAQGGGNGIVTGEATLPSAWESFTIEKLEGDGEIVQGDRITLRTQNGTNFLMARDGGGGEVTANSTNRLAWETFSIEFWNPMLVRLQAHNSLYLAAEQGGGREITASRDFPFAWEVFTLVNRSRKSGLRDGDSVSLQVWDGRFVSAEGGGGGNLLANQNRAAMNEIFTIHKPGGGEISLNDRVSLRTQNGVNYVMALNGGGSKVQATSRQAREWETFQIESAELHPIIFSDAPIVTLPPNNPLPLRRPRMTGSRKLICFVIGFRDPDHRVDDSITSTDLNSFFFGDTNSVRTWIERVSYQAFTVSPGGAFSPLTVPWDYVEIPDQDYFSGLLRLAEAQGFVFRDMDTDHNGIVTDEELLFVVMDCTNIVSGGQQRSITFTYGGVRYQGRVLTVGMYTKGGPIRGRAQLENVLGTITHELGHMIFNLPDRYYQPLPPRGDVVAVSHQRREWERFIIQSSDGPALRSGSRVRLQMQDGGDFLGFDDSPARFLHRGAPRTAPLREFLIEKVGGGEISHGNQINLKAVTTNRYLMAKRGGGDVVQVVAERPRDWETFTIERDAGTGSINSGDVVTLKTSERNVYGTSFYLMAEPNGRRNDPAILTQGWWMEWAKSPSGNGVGGDYDLMDNDKHRGIYTAYDRINLGWLVPKVLTPDNKACYLLNPSVNNAEAFVLWDPNWPDEWYVIENRQRLAGLDDIPSSGLIISWVNENPAYWMRWRINAVGRSPAVISAAALNAPPNDMIELVLLRAEFYKRRDAHTAFRSGTYVLPRGDGSRSRFVLTFRELPPEQFAFCIL